MPIVSIVVPAYNPGDYLEIAIHSVIAQTFSDWELLVVDDGSREDLSHVESLDARVRVLRQKNQGQAVARNKGVLAAQGEFIAFLDADDIWLPSKLETQLEVMRDERIGFSHTQFDIVDADGHKLLDGYGGRVDSYRWLLEGCGVCTSTVVARRDVCLSVGLFDPLAMPSEDYDLWLKMARYHAIGVVSATQAQYRKHDGNLSLRYRVMFEASANILEKHIVAARNKNDHRALASARRGLRLTRETFGAQAFDYSRDCWHQRKISQLWKHLRFALRNAPAFVLRNLLAYPFKALRPK